jgi:hypothetical protein
MKALHLICKSNNLEPAGQGNGIIAQPGKTGNLLSHAWDFTPAQAEELVKANGKIYFHITKQKRAFKSGVIVGFENIDRDDVAHRERIVFIFKPDLKCDNQRWRGMDHGMAWTSGIINIEDN